MKVISLAFFLLACANVQKTPEGWASYAAWVTDACLTLPDFRGAQVPPPSACYHWGDQICRDHGQADRCYSDAMWEIWMDGTDELLHGPW